MYEYLPLEIAAKGPAAAPQFEPPPPKRMALRPLHETTLHNIVMYFADYTKCTTWRLQVFSLRESLWGSAWVQGTGYRHLSLYGRSQQGGQMPRHVAVSAVVNREKRCHSQWWVAAALCASEVLTP